MPCVSGTLARRAKPGIFEFFPGDREGDGCGPKDREIVGVVGVFPDVLSADDEMFAESLLQPCMELVTHARVEGCGRAVAKRLEDALNNGVVAAVDGKNQVLVEGGLLHAGIGDAKDGVGALDVVGEANAGLDHALHGEPVVEVAADA